MFKLIQIVTGLSNGQIKVLYSPYSSLNGAKLLLTKSAKKVTIEDASRAFLTQPIITPHALPMFREDNPMAALQGGREGGVGKRKRERERMDKRKTQRPDAPLTGPGKGGRVGASATQHVVQNLVRDSTRDEDVSPTFLINYYLLGVIPALLQKGREDRFFVLFLYFVVFWSWPRRRQGQVNGEGVRGPRMFRIRRSGVSGAYLVDAFPLCLLLSILELFLARWTERRTDWMTLF